MICLKRDWELQMTYDEEQKFIKQEFEAMFGKYNKEQDSLYTDRPAKRPDFTEFERLINPTLWTKICLFFEEIQSFRFHFPKLEDIYYFMYSQLMGSGDIDGEDEYKCHCKCDLKTCDYTCLTYFSTQDRKPYRDVDMNLPSRASSK